jgi:hypothetical protein
MFEELDRKIEYHEERIKIIRKRYHSRKDDEKGKQWRSEMNHRQRQHRAALESIFSTIQSVRSNLPASGQNAQLRQKLSHYLERLQPYMDQKMKGDEQRLNGSKSYKSHSAA